MRNWNLILLSRFHLLVHLSFSWIFLISVFPYLACCAFLSMNALFSFLLSPMRFLLICLSLLLLLLDLRNNLPLLQSPFQYARILLVVSFLRRLVLNVNWDLVSFLLYYASSFKLIFTDQFFISVLL